MPAAAVAMQEAAGGADGSQDLKHSFSQALVTVHSDERFLGDGRKAAAATKQVAGEKHDVDYNSRLLTEGAHSSSVAWRRTRTWKMTGRGRGRAPARRTTGADGGEAASMNA